MVQVMSLLPLHSEVLFLSVSRVFITGFLKYIALITLSLPKSKIDFGGERVKPRSVFWSVM